MDETTGRSCKTRTKKYKVSVKETGEVEVRSSSVWV